MILALSLLACTYDNDKATDLEGQAQADVKTYVAEQLGSVADAAVAIQDAAPQPDADGWGTGETAGMEAPWGEARDGYERVEAAIAVLFPDLDVTTDQRYDYFIANGPDDDLFDNEGVTGDHAIERIVWADRIPADVVAYESSLPYYSPAAFPSNEADATEFHDELCQGFVDDTASMEDQFSPLALDSAAAFRGVISSMSEQYEKVNLASTGQDESRYAQRTLADMRANLAGGQAIYAAFQPWLLTVDGGDTLDADITDGQATVVAAYDNIDGDAIPAVPADWNPDDPSEEDLATPYGQLWTLLSGEVDPADPTSLVASMTSAADLLGIPEI